jgi:ABC-type transporter Mla maintaining outer membrane lipid asymmetry permease subunit MlaE
VAALAGVYRYHAALAPLVTALIASGKVGSSIGAELGSMRVTEQIDAMEVSGTKPFKFLVCTRVLATTFTIPILSPIPAFIACWVVTFKRKRKRRHQLEHLYTAGV